MPSISPSSSLVSVKGKKNTEIKMKAQDSREIMLRWLQKNPKKNQTFSEQQGARKAGNV